MTRTPTNDEERLSILNESSVVDTFLTTAPHTVSHLRAAIDWHVEQGIKAARYDGDGSTSSSDTSTPTELAALGGHVRGCNRFTAGDHDCQCGAKRRDQAMQDSHDLDRFLTIRAESNQGLRSLLRYLAPSTNSGNVPGQSPCPPGRCVAHWAAGISTAAVKNPKRKRCRPCHDFHAEHGEERPPLVLRAISDLGGTSGPLGHAVLAHPLVLRAWDASGWMTKPTIQKRPA